MKKIDYRTSAHDIAEICKGASEEWRFEPLAIVKLSEAYLALEARCAALEAAVKFYANGYWVDGYPGGCRESEQSNELDFGQTARDALTDNGGQG